MTRGGGLTGLECVTCGGTTTKRCPECQGSGMQFTGLLMDASARRPWWRRIGKRRQG